MRTKENTSELASRARRFERWVTKQQLARHLGVSTRWIEMQHHAGLPSLPVGSRRRYRITEVESWLRTCAMIGGE